MIDLIEILESESCSEMEQDQASLHAAAPIDRQPRHGWKAPPILLQQEKFEHRIIAYLKAEGKSNEEIALQTGMSNTAIGYIIKQPWMEGFILELIAQKGGSKVETFIDDLVMPALETIKEVMLDPGTSKRDRLSAANAALDRRFGKPNQPISMGPKVSVSEMTLAEVDERLATLQARRLQQAN